jgi:large subunit ribosomal protein L30
MAKIKITQTRSRIGSNKRQKATLDALGLRKLNSSVELEGTPQIRGMVNKLMHLVKVEELKKN